MARDHPVNEAETAGEFQKSESNETVQSKEENEEVREGELLIQKLNDLGIGEHVSDDEFLGYFNRLPCRPRGINPALKLTNEELDKQYVHHAMYRFRYGKCLQPAHRPSLPPLKEEGKGDILSLKDISEDDCDQEFLEKQGFFKELEENWTIDWFSTLITANAGTEYSKWTEYHKFLNSSDTEEEYVKYSEELHKRLDWMEVYLNAYQRPSYQWDCISSRGALQAIKIAATTFNKITASLAYLGHYECIQSMAYDLLWFRELDDVYFEIWQRFTQGMMSFREALEEVYELNMFPLRQLRMKDALEYDDTMEDMEEEFHTCTAAIPPGVEGDKAKELIAEAVIKRVDKPKSYEQYIRKNMEIARIIGILPPLEATV
ncbi:hypothetical protein VPH35_074375 [Triticum aestivum]